MEKIKDATLCKYYNDEQGRRNGKACPLHGRCMPFYYNQGCEDYIEEPISNADIDKLFDF